MKIIRYQTNPLFVPAVSYPTLRSEMDRLFDIAVPSLGTLPLHSGFFEGAQAEFPVDLYQDKDAYHVRAELPGFRKEDIGVEVADGVLTISGHEKTEAKPEQKDQAYHERRVARALPLPENLNVEKISAAYENGVLTVTLPTREEVKPRQVTVDVK